jgi:hypothetical protein
VALFVVICGALLMLGGGYSLLMGFDIVMTERGAAMAIGGTVALAGGVVAVGIGGVLLRLSQLLRALEEGQSKVKSAAPDRPVVPIKEPAGSQIDPPVLEPVPASSSLAPVAAGAAVIAAGVGGAVAFGRSAQEGKDNSPDQVAIEPVADDLRAVKAGMPEAEPVSPEPDVVLRQPDPILETLKAEFEPSTVPPPAQPDLEDELARALAEFDTPVGSLLVDAPADVPPLKPVRRRKGWSTRDEADAVVAAPIAEAASGVNDDVPVQDEKPNLETELAADPVAPILPSTLETAPEASEEKNILFTGLAPDIEDLDRSLSQVTAPKVLGTYNVGGRTYSMFADGSVEAMTEFGIERFASMDELRKHLAKT